MDGYAVDSVSSGAEALAFASSRPFNLVLIDQRLPDMLGTDVVRAMKVNTLVPFVLMSAFLTTDVTVEAMKLGAVNVLDKPIWIDELRAMVSSCLSDNAVSEFSTQHARLQHAVAMARTARPASIPDRWALYVLKACESSEDPTTADRWAASVGASNTTIGDCCRLLGMHQRDARDLTRLLRALIQANAQDCPPEALLLVSDSRTLDALFERGGLRMGAAAGSVPLDRFLETQRFVSADNPGLKALRRLLGLESL